MWGQLKGITAGELTSAVKRDGWSLDSSRGSIHVWTKVVNGERRRVSIHIHPQKTFGANMLKGLLDAIGWTEEELRNLKLIK